MDIWGFAAAVGDAVKRSTNEFTETLRNTEWKSEFEDIRKGLQDETTELATNAKVITEELVQKGTTSLRKGGKIDGIGRKTTGNGDGNDTAQSVCEEKETRQGDCQREKTVSVEQEKSMRGLGRQLMSTTSQAYETLSDVFKRDLGFGSHAGREEMVAGVSGRCDTVKKYRRFDAEMIALERDVMTYCQDPNDEEGYALWKKERNMDEYTEEIDVMMEKNDTVKDLYRKLVPDTVNHTNFWGRYLYKRQVLREKHDAIAKVAMLAEQNADEDHVGWENDWDDGSEGEGSEHDDHAHKKDNNNEAKKENGDGKGKEDAYKTGTKGEADTRNDEALSAEQEFRHQNREGDVPIDDIKEDTIADIVHEVTIDSAVTHESKGETAKNLVEDDLLVADVHLDDVNVSDPDVEVSYQNATEEQTGPLLTTSVQGTDNAVVGNGETEDDDWSRMGSNSSYVRTSSDPSPRTKESSTTEEEWEDDVSAWE